MTSRISGISQHSSLGKFSANRLSEAREACGLNKTELAERLNVTRQAISRYELGQLTPAPEVLAGIATHLGQPLSFFSGVRPPEYEAMGTAFFRSFKSATAADRKMCLVWRQWLVDLFLCISRYVNFPKVNADDFSKQSYEVEDIEYIAKQCRRAWGLGDGPIGNTVQLLEANGFIVSRADFGAKKIDAFSFRHGERPYIFLSSDKRSSSRSRFDVAHELGHIILHGWITPEELQDPATLKRIEKEADSFAGAFLLPANSFSSEIFSSRLNHFIELKKRWKVSIGAMIYRCGDLEIFAEDQVLNLRKQMSAYKMRTKEPLDDVIELEQPSLLEKAIKLLRESNVALIDELVNELRFSTSHVERLSSLPEGTLKPLFKAPVVSLRRIN